MSTEEPIKPVTVAELIAFLQKLPQDLPVAYQCFSEQMLLTLDDRCGYDNTPRVMKCREARVDGWVHDERPDMPSIEYLVFPGN